MRNEDLYPHVRRFLRQVHELVQAGLVVPIVIDNRLRYAEPADARRLLKRGKARLATEAEIEADATDFVLAMLGEDSQ